MKKILYMAVIYCLMTTATYAQIDPDIEVDGSGTGCAGDLEMRLHVFLEDGNYTFEGRTVWIPVPSGSQNYTYATISGSSQWDVPPAGPVSGLYIWYFGKIEVRNCNSAGTSGSGTNCTTGLENYAYLEMPSVPNFNCFEYTGSNCNNCFVGDEIELTGGLSYPSSAVFINDL